MCLVGIKSFPFEFSASRLSQVHRQISWQHKDFWNSFFGVERRFFSLLLFSYHSPPVPPFTLSLHFNSGYWNTLTTDFVLSGIQDVQCFKVNGHKFIWRKCMNCQINVIVIQWLYIVNDHYLQAISHNQVLCSATPALSLFMALNDCQITQAKKERYKK